jgi:smad nuclear-interacting protein 1
MDKPDFGLSGKLAEDTNTYRGVVIKYNEPPEAKIPKKRWRLYPFKGEQSLDVLYIHRQSAYLIGRERKIADIPLLHPSISKQHAVLQYRLVNHEREDGVTVKRVKPYVIDLESTNGTYVNNNRIEPSRYVELMEKDLIKFGFSTREYILLHEHSHDSEEEGQEMRQ